jgi:lipopolysaccharide transport system permease protein
MEKELEQVVVYTANDGGGGFMKTTVRSFGDIWRHRHLVWTLFSRDFKAQFKQSLLGYFWTVLGPLLGAFSFVLMNYMGILHPGATPVPYPLYAFIGTSMWGLLVGSIGFMSNGLNAHAELIMRTNIPKIVLAASAFANIAYAMLVNLVLIALFMVIFGVPFVWQSLAFPILTLPLVLVGCGIGLAVSVIGIVARDVTRLVTQFFMLLMFLTPVIFVVDSIGSPLLRRLIMANPLTYLVDLPRAILTGQPSPYWFQYEATSVICVVVFFVGVKIFDLVQDLVAERL